MLDCGGQRELPEGVRHHVLSSSRNVVYTGTKERIETSKHMCMGLGLKSLTGSRKVVDLINKMEHSISYHTAEEIETETASSITSKERVTPDNILQKASLSTTIAWDNYDEMTETLSGKKALHDTVGLCFKKRPLLGFLPTTLQRAHCLIQKKMTP
jgi:hypothetical protein